MVVVVVVVEVPERQLAAKKQGLKVTRGKQGGRRRRPEHFPGEIFDL